MFDGLLTPVRLRCGSAVVLLVALSLLVVAFVSAGARQGQTAFGPPLGADFAAVYIAGQILNTAGLPRLYDLDLQARLYQELFPTAPPTRLPYLNAPFLALPAALLARLPYAWAYAAWVVMSLGLFLGGVRLLWRTLPGLPRQHESTALLVATAFVPFWLETLVGGQTTALGVCAVALAIVAEQRQRPVWSGLTLALLLYKPTLLVLLVPMLLTTGRWAALGGWFLGSLALGLGLGLDALHAWADALRWAVVHTSGSETIQPVHKFVDLSSLLTAVWGAQGWPRWGMLLMLSASGFAWCAAAWNRTPGRLPWAVALAWTPLLNVHFGVYDTPLVLLAGLLVLADHGRRRQAVPALLRWSLVGLYAAPWLGGVPVYTFPLITFPLIVFALLLTHTASRRREQRRVLPRKDRVCPVS